MLKFKKSNLFLLAFFIFCTVLVRIFYIEYLTELRIYDLLRIDRFGGWENIGFLDDTVKFEKTLLTGANLGYYHGGQFLENIVSIAKYLSGGNLLVLYSSIFGLNFYLMFDLYRVFGRRNFFLELFLIPIFAFYTVTINKEIYTIYSLLFISPIYLTNLKELFFKSKNVSKIFCLLRMVIGIWILVSVASARSLIIILAIFVYLFLTIAYLIKTRRILKLTEFKFRKSFSIIFIIGCLILIIFYSRNYRSLVKNISISEGAYLSNKPINISFNKIILSPYALVAPFPFALVKVPKKVDFQGLTNYMVFANYFLGFLSIKRIKDLLFLIRVKGTLKLKNSKYLFTLLILPIVTFLILGDNLTRQLITLLIPLSIYLESSKN